jgi:hypothetical protein
MARRRKSPFNLPEGSYGDYSVKKRRGNPYIASKPIRKKVKQTPALINSKSIFGFLGTLSAAMHSDPKLRGIWETSEIKGENSRHKISSFNYWLVPPDRDMTNFRLTPFDRLFHAPVLETVWGKNKVTVTFGEFEGLAHTFDLISVSARGIVRYYGFKSKGYEKNFYIARISSPPVVYTKGGQHTLLMEYDSDYTNSYNSRQFCFTLIIDNSDGIAIECSENVIL